MLAALMMTCLLPIVFLLALAQSADSRPAKETLAEFARPLMKRLHVQ